MFKKILCIVIFAMFIVTTPKTAEAVDVYYFTRQSDHRHLFLSSQSAKYDDKEHNILRLITHTIPYGDSDVTEFRRKDNNSPWMYLYTPSKWEVILPKHTAFNNLLWLALEIIRLRELGEFED